MKYLVERDSAEYILKLLKPIVAYAHNRDKNVFANTYLSGLKIVNQFESYITSASNLRADHVDFTLTVGSIGSSQLHIQTV